MSRCWREWSNHTSNTPRKWNRKDRRGNVAHCCKYHHDMDADDYDRERDLREGKKEHLREIQDAIRGTYESI